MKAEPKGSDQVGGGDPHTLRLIPLVIDAGQLFCLLLCMSCCLEHSVGMQQMQWTMQYPGLLLDMPELKKLPGSQSADTKPLTEFGRCDRVVQLVGPSDSYQFEHETRSPFCRCLHLKQTADTTLATTTAAKAWPAVSDCLMSSGFSGSSSQTLLPLYFNPTAALHLWLVLSITLKQSYIRWHWAILLGTQVVLLGTAVPLFMQLHWSQVVFHLMVWGCVLVYCNIGRLPYFNIGMTPSYIGQDTILLSIGILCCTTMFDMSAQLRDLNFSMSHLLALAGVCLCSAGTHNLTRHFTNSDSRDRGMLPNSDNTDLPQAPTCIVLLSTLLCTWVLLGMTQLSIPPTPVAVVTAMASVSGVVGTFLSVLLLLRVFKVTDMQRLLPVVGYSYGILSSFIIMLTDSVARIPILATLLIRVFAYD
jgi:hypothetical protein